MISKKMSKKDRFNEFAKGRYKKDRNVKIDKITKLDKQ